VDRRSDDNCKREHRFFAIKIAEHFRFYRNWYRGEEVSVLVLQYYQLLRSILRNKPHLKAYLTRCRHCGIFFLTDPRNRGRRDLGCPFGCKEAHRKHSSTRRSVEYYRTAQGRVKKKLQNDKRKSRGSRSAPVPENSVEDIEVEHTEVSKSMLDYLCILVSLIESRRVMMSEVLQMVTSSLRQHSMARQRKIDHITTWLNKSPP